MKFNTNTIIILVTLSLLSLYINCLNAENEKMEENRSKFLTSTSTSNKKTSTHAKKANVAVKKVGNHLEVTKKTTAHMKNKKKNDVVDDATNDDTGNEAAGNDATNTEEDQPSIANPKWVELFNNPVQDTSNCSKNDINNNGKDGNLSGMDDLYANMKSPMKKKNGYDKENGFGPVAYLFDYISEFRDIMLNEMNDMWKEAKEMEPKAKYEDPYSLNNLLFFYSQQQVGVPEGQAVTMTVDEMLEKMTGYNKNIKADIWKNSISIPQVGSIMEKWGWEQPPYGAKAGRVFVNRYDFDGDGRLNVSEFIFASIVHNQKNFLNSTTCKKYCWTDVLNNIIDPIFLFADCNNDGLVSSENLWNIFKNLKREQPQNWDMYKCTIPGDMPKYFRTTSVNDFVLKNQGAVDGLLYRNDFRLGFLLGFWNRQVSPLEIVQDDARNLKSLRWENDQTDKECSRVLSMRSSP